MLRSHDLLLTAAAFFVLTASVLRRASDKSNNQASALVINDNHNNDYNNGQQQRLMSQQIERIVDDMAYRDEEIDFQFEDVSFFSFWHTKEGDRESDIEEPAETGTFTHYIKLVWELFTSWQCIILLTMPCCNESEFLGLLFFFKLLAFCFD